MGGYNLALENSVCPELVISFMDKWNTISFINNQDGKR